MNYRDRMQEKLQAAYAPETLIIRDDSAQHAGHAGARPEGETHFFIEIHAEAFNGKTRVARQRMVYQTLRAELEEHVHALALKVEGTA